MAEPRSPFRVSPRREFLADLAVAGFIALVGVVELVLGRAQVATGWLLVAGALNVGLAAVLLVRRRWPVPGFAVVVVAGILVELVPGVSSAVPYLSALAAMYTLAVWYPDRRVSWLALGVVLARFAVPGLAALPGSLPSLVSETALAVAVWLWGRSRSVRRAYVESLEERARYLEQAREAAARVAIAEERTRIARELHDVVAHHVSVMTVQAGAGTRVARREGSATGKTLAAIEHTGREALGELRRLLGVLRAEGEQAPDPIYREPHKGIDDLGELVRRARDAGLDVEVEVDGPAVDAGVGLTTYRIVQEALTNVVNHAGRTRVRVVVRRDPDALDVTVVDDGPAGSVPQARTGSGQGLLGMRERVAMLGGQLVAGPRPEGGFRVHARLPVREVR